MPRQRGKALLVGSHSDTQPRGGWLDGALGVGYGIEIVRAFAEDAVTQYLPVDAVAWADEESILSRVPWQPLVLRRTHPGGRCRRDQRRWPTPDCCPGHCRA